ncbi:MAG: DUF1573 domain-containing protein [Ferruginibacter sp.]
MKKMWILFILPVSFMYCQDRKRDKMANPLQPGQEVVFKDTATVKIIDSAYNFGKISEGEKVVYSYRFVNIGKNPLIVSKASPSCGCTIAETPKEPIKTGDTGFIKIEFNSTGRAGEAHKSIHVTSNAYDGFPDLQLTGQVVTADK